MLFNSQSGFRSFLFALLFSTLFSSALNGQMPLRFRQVQLEGAQPFLTIDYLYQDSKGLIWFGTFAGLYSFDGYSLTHYTNHPGDSTSLGDNKVSCIHEDSAGKLWIGTQQGLYCFDPRRKIFKDFTINRYNIGNQYIYRIFSDSSDCLWILAQEGLHKMSLDNYSVTRLDQFNEITDLMIDSQGRVWISDISGIFCKEITEDEFEKNTILRTDEIGFINGILEFQQDNFWIVTQGFVLQYDKGKDSINFRQEVPELASIPPMLSTLADDLIIISRRQDLLIFNTGTKEYYIQPIDNDDPKDPIKNATGSILLDRQKQIWIGNSSGYPYICDLTKRYFQHIPLDIYARMPFVGNLFELFEFEEGKLLIPGLEKPELLNIVTGKLEPFPCSPSPSPVGWNNMTTFLYDDSKIWIGSSAGLLLYDTIKSEFIDFEDSIKGTEILRGTLIRDLSKDSKGNLWITTWWSGVYKIDFKRKVIWTPEIPPFSIFQENPLGRSLFEDSRGNMWIGTRSGLFKYSSIEDTFYVYRHNPFDPESINENTAFSIYEDTLGYIWVGTYGGGLNRLDPETGKFIQVTQAGGLLDNNVFSLIPDAKNNLWLMSVKGITRFNPYEFQISNFTFENGLGNIAYDGFLYGKSIYTGNMFFGGRQGIDIFHPDSVVFCDFQPPVIFTEFELFNEPVPIRSTKYLHSDTFFLDQDIKFTKQIILNYDDRVFTLQYAALDFSAPENIKYAYQLEGFDQDWQYVEGKRSATYTNLDPGSYEFHVKATNADGIWNDEYATMAIIVTPPWWNTYGAYVFYCLLLGTILLIVYRYQRQRWQLQTSLQLQEQEAHRLRELDVFKSNLYSNITHEFRTPLTVIDGTVELIQTKPKEYLKKGLVTIRGQSQKLLDMVNQILDLHRFEAGKMEYHPQFNDVISYINFVVEPFEFQAKSKDLDLQVIHDQPKVMMDFDAAKLSTVISNLLSNAIKYTQEGKIRLRTKVVDNIFFMSIEDTGIGIEHEQIRLIFDRFYQVEQSATRSGEGTGIGLALVKEILAMMHGEIDLQSEFHSGTKVMVKLPITHTAIKSSDIDFVRKDKNEEIQKMQTKIKMRSKSDARILIVEDNPDVRHYLRDLLEDEYQIEEAGDGNQGMNTAISTIPDLIISDIMMPGMDGYEVCHQLRQNHLTDHIPIILLTAKSDLKSSVKGYRKGADSYLIKPFHPDQLKAQIEMLLEQRKRLQEKFGSRYADGDIDEQRYREHRFLARMHQLLLSNLSNDEFGIEDICTQMSVSRSQLHKKIKAISGLSTSIFIRKIRLKEARKLILDSELNMSEIAFQVGFSDPNFFSRVYKKEFGESPRESRK